MRRQSALAAIVTVPALVAALLISATAAYHAIDADAPLFDGPPPASLADAITRGYGVERVYPFIRAGQDPNAPVPVDNPDYTGGARIMASPLMLAVAARQGNIVRMLLNFGARLDLPQNRMAWCLAKEIGNREVEDVLADQGGHAVVPQCTGRRAAATPLLAWLPAPATPR